MEAIQNSIQTLTHHFNSQMAEFQKSLQGAIPAASPTSNIAGQFNTFRAFVLSALAGLQQQVEVLARQTDQLEMRSRRKMLLVHGLPESHDEHLAVSVSASLAKHLKLSDLKEESFSRCQRLGQPKDGKPRAVLVKFHDMPTRNQVWFGKTGLKNTGITLSEFLTRDRHDTFMAARLKFGVMKCWTRDGTIIIIDQNGKRHRVTTKAEVNSVCGPPSNNQVPPVIATSSVNTSHHHHSSQTRAPKVIQPSLRTPLRQKRTTRR